MWKAIAIMVVTVACNGCAALILPAALEGECPVPAVYDQWHRLERTVCATDAQWERAVAREAEEERVDRETRAAWAAFHAGR